MLQSTGLHPIINIQDPFGIGPGDFNIGLQYCFCYGVCSGRRRTSSSVSQITTLFPFFLRNTFNDCLTILAERDVLFPARTLVVRVQVLACRRVCCRSTWLLAGNCMPTFETCYLVEECVRTNIRTRFGVTTSNTWSIRIRNEMRNL